jgi:hypothetical protein
MTTLLSIVDFIVLLLLVVLVLRSVTKEQPQGSGSLVLAICLAPVLIIFGIVSISAYMGLVEVVSSLTQGVLLVVLLGMAALLGFSWAGKAAA